MMAKARRAAGKQRVIFWFNVGLPHHGHAISANLQGGPGCSSFDGSLMEVGPFRTVPASQTESGRVELKLVEGGWEEYANIVFSELAYSSLGSYSSYAVDQPPGTGLSFVPTNGYLHELDQASRLPRFTYDQLILRLLNIYPSSCVTSMSSFQNC